MIAAKVFIAVAALVFILSKIHFSDIQQAFRKPHQSMFLYAAIILLIPNLLIHWFRWHYLLKLIHRKVRIVDSAASYFGGLVAGFITPGRIGEFGRSLFLKDIDRLQALGMVLIEKIYAFIPIIVGGVWGLFFLIAFQIGYDAFLLWPLCLIALVTTLICIWMGIRPGWLRTSLYHLSLFMPSRMKLKQIIHCMDHFKNKQGKHYILLSTLVYGVYITQYCLLAMTFQPIPIVKAMAATTSTMLTKTLLPISFGDIGIREGAAIYYFTKLQVAKVTAFNSSILLFLINIVIPTVIGLFFLSRLTISQNETTNGN